MIEAVQTGCEGEKARTEAATGAGIAAAQGAAEEEASLITQMVAQDRSVDDARHALGGETTATAGGQQHAQGSPLNEEVSRLRSARGEDRDPAMIEARRAEVLDALNLATDTDSQAVRRQQEISQGILDSVATELSGYRISAGFQLELGGNVVVLQHSDADPPFVRAVDGCAHGSARQEAKLLGGLAVQQLGHVRTRQLDDGLVHADCELAVWSTFEFTSVER